MSETPAALPSRTFDRDLSWLDFNRRVLEEADNASLPLLERIKFLAITAGNLDEFFMVRVGGMRLGLDGDTPRQEDQNRLDMTLAKCRAFIADQYASFRTQLQPALREKGIHLLAHGEYRVEQHEHMERTFEETIRPVLSPQALVPGHMPLLTSLKLYALAHLAPGAEGDPPRFAIIPLEPGPSRFIPVPGGEETRVAHVLVEDVVRMFVDRFFPGEKVIECVPFRITRNADMSLEDEAYDLLSEMSGMLEDRKTSGVVRLEILDSASPVALGMLARELPVHTGHIFMVPGPLDLKSLFRIASLPGFDSLRNDDWPAMPVEAFRGADDLFSVIREKDHVLIHPYESFEPVLQFIECAARDPDVLSIKQTLYRMSSDSRVAKTLIKAAQGGKNVTAIVELKARFDEASNIRWAKEMELAGVQVIHGVRRLKTHSKVTLVVRREAGGIRRYIHFGTGNYNESTAKVYSDVSMLTADPELGADASQFFNSITGYSKPQPYRKIAVAPINLRERFIELIERETLEARNGHEAWIMAKMNSLCDEGIVEALYAASRAGVRIALNVRGICILRPMVRGLSENIRVVSVVDRFLEHARIFSFNHGGNPKLFIGSADWMSRNLDRRVELLVPVEDEANQLLLSQALQTYFKDNQNAWELQPDGSFVRLQSGEAKAFRSQRRLYSEARDRFNNAQTANRLTLEPVRASSAR